MAGMKDGYRNDCKACNLAAKHERYGKNRQAAIARVQKWREDNPERYAEYQASYRTRPERKLADRAGHLKRKFGLTLEQYDEMLAAQEGGCAICSDPPEEGKTLHIDHDHATGLVRGLLCQRCNHALGLFREDDSLLQEAAAYVADATAEAARRRLRLLVAG
jgi:hypothetical protein